MASLRQLSFPWRGLRSVPAEPAEHVAQAAPLAERETETAAKQATEVAGAQIAARQAKATPAKNRDRSALSAQLESQLGHSVRVVITDNRRSVIRMTRKRGEYVIRLHHMFLRAPDSVIQDLATFLTRSNRRANARLDRFIDEHHDQIRKGVSRDIKLRARGQVYDLQVLYEELNARFFDGSVKARVTWGRAPSKKGRRRSMRMGTYSADEALIRIHPALDATWVPKYVVAMVMYHEMLHAVVPPIRRGSHKVFHTPEFRRRERAHPDYARATEWEKTNLHRLLRS